MHKRIINHLAPEIWNQTNGKITHYFAAAGTGGTISGVGKYLKEKNPNIKVLAIDSDTSWRTTTEIQSHIKLKEWVLILKHPYLTKQL